jgi:hypothetical protein
MRRSLLVVFDRGRRDEVLIEARLTRIGTDPRCELRLAGGVAEPHVATIEARDGLFLLHNRSARGIRLDDDVVPANQSVPWAPGQTLRLGKDLSLQLNAVGDTLPSWRRRRHPGITPTDPDPDTTSPPPAADRGTGTKSRDAAYITGAILALVIAASSFLLESTSPAQKLRDDFGELAAGFHDGDSGGQNQKMKDPVQAHIFLEIQSARIAELRGDEDQAHEVYGRLRDVLVQLRRPDGTFTKPWLEKVFVFVKQRLR